jgi:uncharacterized protein (TIGR03435 family)
MNGVRTLLFFLAASAASAQRFEVAVIRPSSSPTTAGTSFNVFDGGRIRITNEPVKLLIRTAFQLQNAQIAGGPAWIETDRYDIEAKTGRPEKPAPGTLGPYLQDMLTERFHLKFHREPREWAVWALVVAKGGAKLKPNTDGMSSAMSTKGASQLLATATPMELLAVYVGNRLGGIVVDKTGLKEAYDFTLTWAEDKQQDDVAPALVTALREQLGLELERQKAPVEVLVIDAIERPTEN